MIRAAGTFGTILRKFRNSEGEGYVVVQIPGKRELAFKENCMATVGKLFYKCFLNIFSFVRFVLYLNW